MPFFVEQDSIPIYSAIDGIIVYRKHVLETFSVVYSDGETEEAIMSGLPLEAALKIADLEELVRRERIEAGWNGQTSREPCFPTCDAQACGCISDP